MSEVQINGRLVARWLRTDDADPALLTGCDFDDGESLDLMPIVAVDREKLVLICQDAARVPFARLANGHVVVTAGHPLIAAIDASISPLERRDEMLRRELGAAFPNSIAASDLPVIHAAEMSKRDQRLLDKNQRYAAFRALRHHDLHVQGVLIARVWQAEARTARLPWGDIALYLATFLRDGLQAAKAAAAAQEAFDDPGLGATPGERARLATVQAAALIDKFTRKGGEKADLIAAWNAIGKAWAIEKERDHSEVRAVYNRLETFGPDPR